MGQEPEAIRREIEQQRDEMSDTVDALGYKADVKTRTKDAISDRKDALVSKVSGNTPDSGEVKAGRQAARPAWRRRTHSASRSAQPPSASSPAC